MTKFASGTVVSLKPGTKIRTLGDISSHYYVQDFKEAHVFAYPSWYNSHERDVDSAIKIGGRWYRASNFNVVSEPMKEEPSKHQNVDNTKYTYYIVESGGNHYCGPYNKIPSEDDIVNFGYGHGYDDVKILKVVSVGTIKSSFSINFK